MDINTDIWKQSLEEVRASAKTLLGPDVNENGIEFMRMYATRLEGFVQSLMGENAELVEALNEYESDELERRNHERQYD